MTVFVLNTRPSHQAASLSNVINTLEGATAIELPLLKIISMKKKYWQELCPPKKPEMLIFISANAVENSIDYLKNYWPIFPTIVAIGPATKRALERHGVIVNIMPDDFNSASLIQHPLLHNIKHKTIILIKGCGGRQVLQDFIKHKEANLIELNVYKRTCPPEIKNQIRKTWQNYEIDIILIYSIESLKNIISNAPSSIAIKIKNTPHFVISERVKEYALKIGITNVILVKESFEQKLNAYMRHRKIL